ncbi:Uncharacterised protein [Mycobacteroides abscessus subsp. abscessus]|nr:Uncharacterised protein [Mycobacteroides abscessus subsp. abscessus]
MIHWIQVKTMLLLLEVCIGELNESLVLLLKTDLMNRIDIVFQQEIVA